MGSGEAGQWNRAGAGGWGVRVVVGVVVVGGGTVGGRGRRRLNRSRWRRGTGEMGETGGEPIQDPLLPPISIIIRRITLSISCMAATTRMSHGDSANARGGDGRNVGYRGGGSKYQRHSALSYIKRRTLSALSVLLFCYRTTLLSFAFSYGKLCV